MKLLITSSRFLTRLFFRFAFQSETLLSGHLLFSLPRWPWGLDTQTATTALAIHPNATVSNGSHKGRLVQECTWFINTGQCWMWKGQNDNEYRNENCTLKKSTHCSFYLLIGVNKCSKITFSSRWPVRIKFPDRKLNIFCITSVHWRALSPPIPAPYNNQRMAVSLGTPIS